MTGLLILAGIGWLHANETDAWNQDKAKTKVAQMLEVETKGLVWDKIPWRADAATATREAAKTKKPIFLFLAVKTDVGPPEAPC